MVQGSQNDGTKARALPLLYWGQSPFFGHRSVDKVQQRLEQMVAALSEAQCVARYSFHACRLDGHYGLYGREVFNRAVYRRRLMRRGLEFADEPLTQFHGGGTFSSDDWGSFEAEFVILADDAEDGDTVELTTGAPLIWQLAGRRVGRMQQAELSSLVELSETLPALSSPSATALVQSLKSTIQSRSSS